MLDGSAAPTPPSTTEAKPPETGAKEGDPAAEKKAEEAKPVDPASYKIEVPEGMALDENLSKGFREFAAKQNLSQEQVSELSKLYVQAQQSQLATFETMVGDWSKAVTEDKDMGGANWEASKLDGNRAVQFLFGEDKKFVKEILSDWKIGTHPGFVKAMVRLGKLMKEGSFDGKAGGTGASKERSAEEAIYGTTGNFNPAKQQ